MTARRLVALIPALAVALVVGVASPAAADPAGPTDYETEILSIEPAVDDVEVTILGGDSFVQLVVDPGTEVSVVGYRGEPYLRFAADGVVEVNERSPARWLNDDRYGDTELPPDVDAEAEPSWVVVATGGSYAWHDHRAHWMNEAKPPGAEAGDVILEAVIPLRVDGEPVSVSVQSRLLAPPGPWASLVGALVGVAVVTGARIALGPIGVDLAGGLAAVAALVVGAIAYLSVPPETGPSVLLWALPAVAVVSLAAWAWARRSAIGASPLAGSVGPALVALAGLELLGWAWFRREAILRALIPSDVPASVDRVVIVAVTIVAFGLLGDAVRTLGRTRITEPSPATG